MPVFGRATRPARRLGCACRPAGSRSLAKAEQAVATTKVSIALAYRTFEASEICFRYSPCRPLDADDLAEKQGMALSYLQRGQRQQNPYVERYNRMVRHE